MPEMSSVEDAKAVAFEHDREKQIRNYEALAALETIRVNQFVPFNLIKIKKGSLDTSSERLEVDQFEPGYIYIITSMVAVEIGTGTPQVKIGIKDGATDVIFESATVGNAEDSIAFIGQLMAKETDRPFVIFESAVASDTAYFVVHGYKIKV